MGDFRRKLMHFPVKKLVWYFYDILFEIAFCDIIWETGLCTVSRNVDGFCKNYRSLTLVVPQGHKGKKNAFVLKMTWVSRVKAVSDSDAAFAARLRDTVDDKSCPSLDQIVRFAYYLYLRRFCVYINLFFEICPVAAKKTAPWIIDCREAQLWLAVWNSQF